MFGLTEVQQHCRAASGQQTSCSYAAAHTQRRRVKAERSRVVTQALLQWSDNPTGGRGLCMLGEHMQSSGLPRPLQRPSLQGFCAHRAVTTRRVAVRAAAFQQAQRDLWAYEGSYVSSINLESYRSFHRSSFGHRNLRTYVVVVYDPSSTACKGIEFEVERLAAGLSYEPRVCVAKLNTRAPGVQDFLDSVLQLRRVPTILVYPEATTGFIRFKGDSVSAEGLLDGINKLYARVLPNREPLELVGVQDLSDILGIQGTTASTAASASTTTATAAPVATDMAAAAAAAGGHEAAAQRGVAVLSPERRKTSWESFKERYWSQDKALFWGGLLAISVFMFAWDTWLEEWWDKRSLQRRQQQRMKGAKFEPEQNAEDFLQVMMDRIMTKAREEQVAEARQAVEARQEAALAELRELRGRLLQGEQAQQQQRQQQQTSPGAQDQQATDAAGLGGNDSAGGGGGTAAGMDAAQGVEGDAGSMSDGAANTTGRSPKPLQVDVLPPLEPRQRYQR